jgi:hypothetical protein
LDIVEDVQSEIFKHEEEPDDVQKQQPMAVVLAAIEKLELVRAESAKQTQKEDEEEAPLPIEGEEKKDEQGDMFTDEVDEWSIILDEDDDSRPANGHLPMEGANIGKGEGESKSCSEERDR